MRFLKSVLLASTLLSANTLAAQADVKVVASIKPIHSLVAAVMDGVGSPDLIVDGAGSPHTYALKPSQAAELQEADVVFWVGHELEAFLEKPLEAIASKAKTVELLDAHDLVKLKFREGGAFDEHDHDDHDAHDEDKHDDHAHDEHSEDKHDDHAHDEHSEDKHDDHAHDEHSEDKHDDHAHDEHSEDKHDAHAHGEHGHDGFDPHVWLDPVNAKALVHEIEETLVKADPENAAKYEANAEATMSKLDALVDEVSSELAPVQSKKFVVFHDAYQHFEKRFGLSAIGSITVSPEVIPGAERISELQGKVKELNASCVFAEPQFEPRLVKTVIEGTQTNTGVLDPLGTSIEDGPNLYFTLIRNMANSFKDCLSK